MNSQSYKNLPNVFEILNQEGQLEPIQEVLKDVELVALYFSAHWCPPCRQFTPFLAQFYEAVQESSKKMEIIYVSSDKDEQQFKEYFSLMGFKAVPFDDDRNGIKTFHGVRGIPTLPLFSKNGAKLSENLRQEVMQALQDNKVDELVIKYCEMAAQIKTSPDEINEDEMPQIVPELKKAKSGVMNEQQDAALALYKAGQPFDLIQKCLGKGVNFSMVLNASQNLNTAIDDLSLDDPKKDAGQKNTCELPQEEEKQPEGLNFELLMS